MTAVEKLASRVYIVSVGAATSLLAHKLLKVTWKLVTGKKPPSPTDRKMHWVWWISWALAGAIGTVVSQLAAERLSVRRVKEVIAESTSE
jgi:Protein of unknown function (DUF4235)